MGRQLNVGKTRTERSKMMIFQGNPNFGLEPRLIHTMLEAVNGLSDTHKIKELR